MNKTDYVIAVLFILALIGAYSIYAPFILPFIVALLLSMATSNLYTIFIKITRSRFIGSFILSLIMSFLLFMPLFYIATIGSDYISKIDNKTALDIIENIEDRLKTIPMLSDWISENFKKDKIYGFVSSYTSTLQQLGSKGFGFLSNMFFVIIFYFIINLHGEKIYIIIESLLPIDEDKKDKMLYDISSIMEIVFYSTIVTAIFEGFLFAIMVQYFGFNGLLFGILFGLASLIPIVGGSLLWVPMSLYLWSLGDVDSAIFIGVYSVVVISIIADTFIKPIIIKLIKEKFLKKDVAINELLIFFSIFAGMGSYGFWGIILGPAVTSLLIAISKVYIEFYGDTNPHE